MGENMVEDMMSDRFNKSNMLAALEGRADELRRQYGFDQNLGTAQLKGKLDTQDAAVAYGQFRILHDLIQQVEDGSLIRRYVGKADGYSA